MNSTVELNLLQKFAKKLPDFLRTFEGGTYYAPGGSLSWPVQSNFNIFTALAVMGTDPRVDSGECERYRAMALELLRYGLRAHTAGGGRASDGGTWGRTWISSLGLERMTPGLCAMSSYLTEEDRSLLRNVRRSEADFLLDEYPVAAGLEGPSGKNRPESNIWNGAALVRCAVEDPSAPRAAEYLEKGRKFLLNGICVPSDAEKTELFGGRPLKEWIEGANFFESYSLDHHAYLNLGYMIIALSNLALLDLTLPQEKNPVRAEIRRHADDLWNLVRNLTFPDGRLLRIGGDSRVRYTYCQLYSIPVWFWMKLRFGDDGALGFEERYVQIMKKEMDFSADGTFFGPRLARLRELSYLYYTRLESDAAATLAHAVWFRRMFPDAVSGDSAAPEKTKRSFEWHEDFAGAAVVRTEQTVRSWCVHASQGPTGLCQSLSDSSFAEWQSSMHGRVETFCGPAEREVSSSVETIPGGFAVSGATDWVEYNPKGEGEPEFDYARHCSAAAALPDGETMLVFEYAFVTREVTLSSVRGLSFLVPNDLFNDGVRRVRAGKSDFIFRGPPSRDETVDLKSGDLSFCDGGPSVSALYGGTSWKVIRRKERNIVVHSVIAPYLPSLYAEEFVLSLDSAPGRVPAGRVLLDCGGVFTATGKTVRAERLDAPGLIRAARVRAVNGKVYVFRVNFGNADVEWNGEILPAGKARLSEECRS